MMVLASASSKVRQLSILTSTVVDIVAALLRETQNQLRTTEARLRDAGDDERHPATHRNGQDDRINAPQRLSDVTMAQIRADLGYDKPKWRTLRVRWLLSLLLPTT
jgi:hypothetical protein